MVRAIAGVRGEETRDDAIRDVSISISISILVAYLAVLRSVLTCNHI